MAVIGLNNNIVKDAYFRDGHYFRCVRELKDKEKFLNYTLVNPLKSLSLDNLRQSS